MPTATLTPVVRILTLIILVFSLTSLPSFLLVTVTVDLYDNAAKTETTYVIPGPPLYGGASQPAPPPTTAPTTVPTTVAPTTPPPTTAPPTTAPAPTQTGTVAQYGQCGGLTYVGPTAW